jgi:hypothetical protein
LSSSSAGHRVGDVNLAAEIPDDGFRHLGQVGDEGAQEAHRPELEGVPEAIVVTAVLGQPLPVGVIQVEMVSQLHGRRRFGKAPELGTNGGG